MTDLTAQDYRTAVKVARECCDQSTVEHLERRAAKAETEFVCPPYAHGFHECNTVPTPAPAVPAEEETKAERDSEGIIRINGGRIVALSCDTREMVQRWFDIAKPDSKWQRDYAAALDLFDREAASSPVVPAPTETGPWQTWQEVPEGVPFKSHNGMDVVWRREGALVWFKHFRQDARDLNDLAPFVAAEEGDA